MPNKNSIRSNLQFKYAEYSNTDRYSVSSPCKDLVSMVCVCVCVCVCVQFHMHVCAVRVCHQQRVAKQEYEEAERCVDRVLQMEPTNRQAKQLKELVTKKIRRGACVFFLL